jgi:hypothetical protein
LRSYSADAKIDAGTAGKAAAVDTSANVNAAGKAGANTAANTVKFSLSD